MIVSIHSYSISSGAFMYMHFVIGDWKYKLFVRHSTKKERYTNREKPQLYANVEWGTFYFIHLFSSTLPLHSQMMKKK